MHGISSHVGRPTNLGPTAPDHPHIKHESIETTQVYLHADMTMKENALARSRPTGTPPGRYKPTDDDLKAFLRSL